MPHDLVRIVTSGPSDPVRIVTSGPSRLVHIVTSFPSDPIRIVTSGVSEPVRLNGGLAPDAPTFVSAEVGNVDASTLVATFSTNITAPGGNYVLGFAVLVNGAPDAITAAVTAGATISFTLTTAVVNGDAVTISYSDITGDVYESTGVTPLATFAAQAVTNNVASNGLLNNLIAYWPGNEANGNALDMHTNGLTLNDINTVTSNAGLVYATARQYTRISLEYHGRAGDDALLSVQDVDFTLASWAYLDSKPAGSACTLASKFGASGQWAYILYYDTATDRFRFAVSSNGTTNTSVAADILGVPSLSTWYFVIGWHDSVANTVNIQINNTAVNSLPHATGAFDNTAAFRIGNDGDAYSYYMNGRIGPTMFWKSAAGAGGVLTAAQRTALYNAGAGLPYASFTA